MAIEGNKAEESVAGGVQLYTGITNMKVVAINPSLEELHELGLMFLQEPKYTVNFSGEEKTKLVFWLQNKDALVPLEVIVTPGDWESTKSPGKFKWYNAEGQDTWVTANADGTLDESKLAISKHTGKAFFQNPETAYRIPRGMDTVIDFIRAWCNIASGGKGILDTMGETSLGNVAELREVLEVYKENEVRVMVYVRDGKYQAVYTDHFGRIKPQRDALFTTKMAESEYTQIKGEFSYEWKTYTPGLPSADPTGDAISTDTEWLGEADDLDAVLDGLDA